ncbi:MAG TPA: cell division protein ZapA [Alphaproteobacteria bacterium]|nr:cell division protein ZapA [Alphaproteobacteria bacterium]
MSMVKINILDHQYDISCDNGMEDHVRKLAQDLSLRLQELRKSSGAMDENRLLIITGLLLINEVNEGRGSEQKTARPPDPKVAGLTEIVEKLIKRVESLAEKLEKR